MTRSSVRATHPAPAAPAAGRPLRRAAPPVPDRHLETLGELLHELLPSFTARGRAHAERDHILPIAEGLLRGRNAIREGKHGHHRGRRHLLLAVLHTAHLAYPGAPRDRLANLLDRQRRRLHHRQRTEPRPWLETPPRRHYDRALTEAVGLAYELDRPGGPTPHRLQTQAADLANRILYYLILTDALTPRASAERDVAPG